MKTFGIEINDLRSRRERTVKLDGWKTAEEAAETAWQLLLIITDYDPTLACENQGDQFMAYFTDGVTDGDTGEALEGIGAITVKIINPDGTYYENL